MISCNHIVCVHQEENEGGELLGFNTVATKLLAVVTAPIHSALVSKQEQVRLSMRSDTAHTCISTFHCALYTQLVVSPVVCKAGQLLLSRINEVALCIAYPESASLSGMLV